MKSYNGKTGKRVKKFMQVLDVGIFGQLQSLAKSRGVTTQEYIRVIVIPEHLYKTIPKVKQKSKWSKRVKKGWVKRRLNKLNKEPAPLPEQIPVVHNPPLESLPSQ